MLEQHQQQIKAAAAAGLGKLIPISRGLLTLVDIHRYDEIHSMGKWTAFKSNKGNQIYYYAGRKDNEKLIMLSRYLINCPLGLIADHENGNTLFNLETNLRAITKRENRLNSHNMHGQNSSGHEGVYWNVLERKWIAQLGKQKIGGYDRIEEAVAARVIALQSSVGKEIWETSLQHQNNKQFLQQSKAPKIP